MKVDIYLMCGRYVLYSAMEAIRDIFGLHDLPADDQGWLNPRYNIAPTQMVAIVRSLKDPSERELSLARWGLVPSWAKTVGDGPLNINARGETVAQKPSFRAAFARRRCLIPADGFYEWQKQGKLKLPHYFSSPEQQPLALAGLWEGWTDGNKTVESCAIITTSANAVVEPVHHRMPVIIAPGARDLWLDPGTDPTVAGNLIRPAPADTLFSRPVSRRVNRTQEEAAELIEPLTEAEEPPPPKGKKAGKQLSLL